MNDQMWVLVDLAAITLLPMLPAIALFKGLKSKATATGTIWGLKIDVVGGFGGYFILFVGLLAALRSFRPSPYVVYTVTGKLTIDGKSTLPDNKVRFNFHPSASRVDGDGNYTLTVSAGPGATGLTAFPSVQVEHDNCYPATLDLTTDGSPDANNQIKISKTVELSTVVTDSHAQVAQPMQ